MLSKNNIYILLWITIFCNSMCFFGYVYEEIVDIPNILFSDNSIKVNELWSNYHIITNPAHYYGFITSIGIISLILLWINKKVLSEVDFKKLKIASGLIILATIITTIAVTQINDFVFFGKPLEQSQNLHSLSIIWSILNFIRLSFTFLATLKLLSIFKITLSIKN